MNKLLFLFLILYTPLFTEELVVTLRTEADLLPTYLGKIESKKSDFSGEYLHALSQVLEYDLANNGALTLISDNDKRAFRAVINQESYDSDVSFHRCKEAKMIYWIKLKNEGKALSCKIISVPEQNSTTIVGLMLSGDIAKDRRMIHTLHDRIHEVLFQKPGIASTRILYTLRSSPTHSEIYEADWDGYNIKQLTHEKNYIVTPVFAPQGTLVYVSYKIGQPKIYYATLHDGKSKRLTPLKGNQMTPQVSLDGSRVAFACDTTGTSDIFIQDFHPVTGSLSKPRQIFASKGATSASPVFSPDASRIAFVSNKDGSPKIYVMDVPKEGASIKQLKPQLISKKMRENSAPSWSPDGKKIAYSAKAQGNRQIWVYDIETQSETQLTNGTGDKENPVWASNSLHLLFNATTGKETELFVINIHQKKAVQITHGSGEKRFPYWEKSDKIMPLPLASSGQ